MDIQMSLQWRNPTGSLSFHYHYHLISSPSMATLFSAQKIDNCNIRPWNSGKLPWNYYVSINFGWLLRYLRHKHRDFARIDDVPTKKTSISFGDFPRNHVDDQIDVCFNGFKGQITMAKSSISTKYWIWLGKWWRRLPRADFFFLHTATVSLTWQSGCSHWVSPLPRSQKYLSQRPERDHTSTGQKNVVTPGCSNS
jgi:hypothetical protein